MALSLRLVYNKNHAGKPWLDKRPSISRFAYLDRMSFEGSSVRPRASRMIKLFVL